MTNFCVNPRIVPWGMFVLLIRSTLHKVAFMVSCVWWGRNSLRQIPAFRDVKFNFIDRFVIVCAVVKLWSTSESWIHCLPFCVLTLYAHFHAPRIRNIFFIHYFYEIFRLIKKETPPSMKFSRTVGAEKECVCRLSDVGRTSKIATPRRDSTSSTIGKAIKA